MLRKLRSLRRLDAKDRRRALRAVLTLLNVSWSLRLLGLARTRDRLRRRSTPLNPASGSDVETLVSAWEWAVRLAARNVPCRARCLEQSLSLWYLLRRSGVDTVLRIGVRKGAAHTLEAHAWVELDGRPINDRPDIGQSYAAFEGPLPSTAEVR